MSNTLRLHVGDEYREAEEIGTNGSMHSWFAILLAGYSISGQRESSRVRARWIEECTLTPFNVLPRCYPRDELGIDYAQARTVGSVQRLIGFNKDNRHWFTTADKTIARGLQLKPISCPVLQAIMWLHDDRGADDSCYARITGDAVGAFAQVYATIVPHLQQSCWAGLLARLGRVVQRAGATPAATLSIG